MRLQNRVGNKKWETLGHILSPIEKKDSYNIKLDNLQEDIYHRRHIRKEPESGVEFNDLDRELPNLEKGKQRKSDVTPTQPKTALELRTQAQTRNSCLQNRA